MPTATFVIIPRGEPGPNTRLARSYSAAWKDAGSSGVRSVRKPAAMKLRIWRSLSNERSAQRDTECSMDSLGDSPDASAATVAGSAATVAGSAATVAGRAGAEAHT